jgi:hypothetical protein
VRILVLDPSGCGLGLAIGLVELGHAVRHAGPRAWAETDVPEPVRCCRELAARFFGAQGGPLTAGSIDLLVVVDVFADLLAEVDPSKVVRHARRIQAQIDAAARAPRVVVFDASDCQKPRAAAFEQLPHAVLLAREVARGEAGRWQPFPFLYNNVMLWLEHLRPPREWWVPEKTRQRQWDWAFCGTLDHPRYGERRRRALAAVAQRWPELRSAVRTEASFVEVMEVLQGSRTGLDLPGAGELCFRLHECLALGVPVLQPQAPAIEFTPGLAPVLLSEPADLTADEVREIHLQHYAPSTAAARLLAALAHGLRRLAVR